VIFEIFAQKKLLRGAGGFLKGFLRFRGVLWMVNRGEVVVNCVADVVF